jgi:hypothetical protein
MPEQLVIHKYRLPFKSELAEVVEVTVRVGKLLHLAIQHDDVHVWAAVDPARPEVAARFRLVGTGSPVDPSWHLGTVLDSGYVWHIFSEKPIWTTDV